MQEIFLIKMHFSYLQIKRPEKWTVCSWPILRVIALFLLLDIYVILKYRGAVLQ